MKSETYVEPSKIKYLSTNKKRHPASGVLISYILGGEIVFTHATVAIRQGSENWPLQI
ncbi:hypothetical protein JOD24_002273 [Kroppenstedtia sanguinis]|uniref:Uncharacterized protein n=1 Tax=Kroppenstedtia sanguinis TaxID=1380684 RepID=A0ABW4CA41_9BACL